MNYDKKTFAIILLLPTLLNFAFILVDSKLLDLGSFKITIPKSWNYKKLRGEDSFVGEILGQKILLQFDYSNSGYANSLISSEQEYLNRKEWMDHCYFCKTGVTYTANSNVKNEKAEQMKKLGTTDSTLVHVEADPDYQTKINTHLPSKIQKIKFPKADYIADLTYKGSTIYIPIQIPTEIKIHQIQIDTTEKYIIKTIWPKVPGKGITAIYFKSRSSNLNFNMVGSNLPKQEQDLALKAFKTIKLKDR